MAVDANLHKGRAINMQILCKPWTSHVNFHMSLAINMQIFTRACL